MYYPKGFTKAYKDYVCCECGETIEHHTIYYNLKLVEFGKYKNYKYCLKCAEGYFNPVKRTAKRLFIVKKIVS